MLSLQLCVHAAEESTTFNHFLADILGGCVCITTYATIKHGSVGFILHIVKGWVWVGHPTNIRRRNYAGHEVFGSIRAVGRFESFAETDII